MQWQEDTPTSSLFPRPPHWASIRHGALHGAVRCHSFVLGCFSVRCLGKQISTGKLYNWNSFHHPVMDILGCSTLPVGGFHDPLLQVEVASFQRVASTINLESTLKPESNPQKSPDILKTGIPNGGEGMSEMISTRFLLRLGYRLYRAHLGMLVFQAWRRASDQQLPRDRQRHGRFSLPLGSWQRLWGVPESYRGFGRAPWLFLVYVGRLDCTGSCGHVLDWTHFDFG